MGENASVFQRDNLKAEQNALSQSNRLSMKAIGETSAGKEGGKV